jgi:hypothetical protein
VFDAEAHNQSIAARKNDAYFAHKKMSKMKILKLQQK